MNSDVANLAKATGLAALRYRSFGNPPVRPARVGDAAPIPPILPSIVGAPNSPSVCIAVAAAPSEPLPLHAVEPDRTPSRATVGDAAMISGDAVADHVATAQPDGRTPTSPGLPVGPSALGLPVVSAFPHLKQAGFAAPSGGSGVVPVETRASGRPAARFALLDAVFGTQA
ncbi:hypothetical protein [Paracraurococcus ruber]|uniref:hypothetical protein n=1 Tax=Paracraurococcus ruber TaxID=77675 RepID=UPI001057966F|nr:hypothetical protein [Paracraurococcus ruber]TDG30750.1 hypothetical protein E2C05_13275 [Paracraurococcus ruber]